MSNRPNRKSSRSTGSYRSGNQGSGRGRTVWIVASVVGVVLIAVVLAVVLVRKGGSSEPVLDAKASQGKQLASQKGCLNCHSTTGDMSEGPTWKGLYGKERKQATGATLTADDAYLLRAIAEPNADMVAGYRGGMPTVQLTDEERAALVAYIKALR